jgi:DNA-binding IclR family transcriptional regulator
MEGPHHWQPRRSKPRWLRRAEATDRLPSCAIEAQMRSLRKMLTNADSNGSVRSVDRALQLLEQLSASRGANLSQLARDTGLAVSTCHRLLTTLQGRGFVHYERKSARWAVGSRALAVGASFANARDLVGLARPIMDRAARESGEIVNLGAAADYDVLFLYRINPRAPTRMSPPAAERIPIHCSSIGKAILAALREPRFATFSRLDRWSLVPRSRSRGWAACLRNCEIAAGAALPSTTRKTPTGCAVPQRRFLTSSAARLRRCQSRRRRSA